MESAIWKVSHSDEQGEKCAKQVIFHKLPIFVLYEKFGEKEGRCALCALPQGHRLARVGRIIAVL